jgi:serine/threonine-protein kinase
MSDSSASTPAPPATDRDALHSLCLADRVFAERYEGWVELGRGGSATVVRTRSKVTGEELALKIFHGLSVEQWQRFQQEVRTAQQLSSPFIVRSYSPFPRGSLSWIEMELVDGPNLREELERREREGRAFSTFEALAIARDLTRALQAAHEAGAVHRDVKPANVLLPRSGRPAAKLGDFGLSRLSGAARLTHTGLLAGTPQFVAPELIAGEPASPASDVYSLSLCLYLLFSGNRFPYEVPAEAPPAHWLRVHGEARPRLLTAFDAGAPAALADLLARGLAKQPARRPTAAEADAVLRDLVESPRIARARANVSRTSAAGIVLALLLLGLLVGVWVRRDVPRSEPRAGPAPSPTLALASPRVPAGPPAEASPAAPSQSSKASAPALFRASLEADLLRIANTSREPLADLSLTLVGAGGSRHQALAEGTLVPGGELVLAIDSFAPVPAPGFEAVQLEIAATDASRKRRRALVGLR